MNDKESAGGRCKKSSKKGRRPAWLSHDLLVKLKGKKELRRQFRQDQISWEEYRDSAWLCRDEVRKSKARLELNLARDAKNNKKGFYRYDNQRRKVKESVPPMMSKNGKLVTTDEKTVLNNFFASVFTVNLSPHTSQVEGPGKNRGYENEEPPTVGEDQVQDLLRNLKAHNYFYSTPSIGIPGGDFSSKAPIG
ncbi:hypothetical protein llap_15633 [Limosa lapponica baueri]|uniref:Rna-directed dna polymerase from mobile element jockey-like n=1 Tax=Limosa lapponica baueri TaxID=1758121 RepID=A0A2I0TJX8_LIMLA|nr:hypothetical protein llap_15633 [Limosa lapponica baueri]